MCWGSFGRPVCTFILGFQGVFCAASEYTLVGISIYCMLSVTHPSTVRNIFARRSVVGPMIWFVPALSGSQTVDLNKPCLSSRSLWLRISLVCLHAVVPTTVLICTNIRTCIRLNSRMRPCQVSFQLRDDSMRANWNEPKISDSRTYDKFC